MKTIIITQARCNARRFPNKVLKEINGETLLEIHLKRILKCRKANKIIVATTTNSDDIKIAEIASKLDVEIFRGSEHDVLDRFYFAAKDYNPDYIVRLTSDCPLIDPELIDYLIEESQRLEFDYISNNLNKLYPDGQDIEVFKFSALEKSWFNAKLKSEREHVTQYIRNNSSYFNKKLFKAKNYKPVSNFNSVRLTVDEIEDFEVIKKIINELGTDLDWRSYADFYTKNSKINYINNKIIRNEGLLKSINED